MEKLITRSFVKTTGKYTEILIDENGKPYFSDEKEFTIYTARAAGAKDIAKATNNSKAVYGIKSEEIILGIEQSAFIANAKPVSRPKSQQKKGDNE